MGTSLIRECIASSRSVTRQPSQRIFTVEESIRITMHFSSIDGNGTQHMQHTTKLLPAIHRHIFRMAWLFLIISIFYTFVPGRVSAHNSQAPGGNVTDPTIRNVDLAQPSVVRIITGVKGHLKVH